MAKRILVPIERTKAMEFTLRVARMLAGESGGIVRLLEVVRNAALIVTFAKGAEDQARAWASAPMSSSCIPR